MNSILLVIGSFALYVVAYNTYGRFLARRIFRLDDSRKMPSVRLSDGQDFVPTKTEVVFGHHFTSIAGTGPIVGPAIAIIWGWVPALLWVLFGSILMGAVHDFSALILSARHEGRTVGDLAGKFINRRARFLFLTIIFFELLIVIAVFCLVIATLFSLYPEAVLPVWGQLPIAVGLGWLIFRKIGNINWLALGAVALLYALIYAGVFLPFSIPSIGGFTPLMSWTVILLIYAAIASTIPVWQLLQPRDYINGHQLVIAMALLVLGVFAARPEIVAPAANLSPPGAPPIWPMLFIIIACGAISGFHCLVGSGTSSKQICNESAAFRIGYGGMLLEGMLAVLVIIAVAAGVGMMPEGSALTGSEAWRARYASWGAASGLSANVGAFVDGSANMLRALGIPQTLALTLMGVFVACFASTTLDTATRLQRYVITEMGRGLNLRFLANKYVATGVAVATAALLAFPGKGKGGLILWPLFGAVNQLLACLALLVATVYLRRTGRPLVFTLLPMLFMLVMTGWAMVYNLNQFLTAESRQWHLILIGAAILVLEVWMVIEAFVVMAGKPLPMAEAEDGIAAEGAV